MLYPDGGTPPTTNPQDVEPQSSWLPNTGGSDIELIVWIGVLLVILGVLVILTLHSRRRV